MRVVLSLIVGTLMAFAIGAAMFVFWVEYQHFIGNNPFQ